MNLELQERPGLHGDLWEPELVMVSMWGCREE